MWIVQMTDGVWVHDSRFNTWAEAKRMLMEDAEFDVHTSEWHLSNVIALGGVEEYPVWESEADDADYTVEVTTTADAEASLARAKRFLQEVRDLEDGSSWEFKDDVWNVALLPLTGV